MEQKGLSIDDSTEGLSVRSWDGTGYKPVVQFGAWCFAELNHAEKFKAENLSYRERHLKTDETFVLLEGEATLLIGEVLTPIRMEKFRFYNVKAGTWHQINTVPGTRVLIVENADVDEASERADIWITSNDRKKELQKTKIGNLRVED